MVASMVPQIPPCLCVLIHMKSAHEQEPCAGQQIINLVNLVHEKCFVQSWPQPQLPLKSADSLKQCDRDRGVQAFRPHHHPICEVLVFWCMSAQLEQDWLDIVN
jgi:hypothetical protein